MLKEMLNNGFFAYKEDLRLIQVFVNNGDSNIQMT